MARVANAAIVVLVVLAIVVVLTSPAVRDRLRERRYRGKYGPGW